MPIRERRTTAHSSSPAPDTSWTDDDYARPSTPDDSLVIDHWQLPDPQPAADEILHAESVQIQPGETEDDPSSHFPENDFKLADPAPIQLPLSFDNFFERIDDDPEQPISTTRLAEGFVPGDNADIPNVDLPDIDLPDFEPDLHQPPTTPLLDDHTVIRAREKAAVIVTLLPIRTDRELEVALDYLTGFFSDFQHHATYRAIHRMAEDDLDLQMLRAMVELRAVWNDHAAWSQPIYYRDSDWRTYETPLSWILAYRICRSRWQHPPEQMIDEDWFNEWTKSTHCDRRTVPFFATFLKEKIEEQRTPMFDPYL